MRKLPHSQTGEVEATGKIPSKILNLSFLEYLFQFFKQTEIHGRENQIFTRCMENVMRTVEIYQAEHERDSIEFSFKGEQLYINQQRIRVQGRQVRSNRFLVRFMRRRLIGKVSFSSKVSSKELSDFFWTIADAIQKNKEEPFAYLEDWLKDRSEQDFHIERAMKAGEMFAGRERKGSAEDLDLISLGLYDKLFDHLRICFDNLEHASQFPKLDLDSVFNDLVNLPTDDLMQVFRLRVMRSVEFVHPALAVDVSFALIAWAKSLGLPFGVAADLGKAGLTHPLIYLLRKNLDFSPIKEEEVFGVFELVDRLKASWRLEPVHKLVAMEWTQDFGELGVYQVTGAKCFAHFFSRMTRVLAVFRALTLNRRDGSSLLPDEAMTELIRMDRALDPSLVKIFVNWMGIYPVGCLVQLVSGEVAQVFSGGADPMRFKRPVVSIVKDSDGRVLERPQLFDLSQMNEKLGVYRKSIKRSMRLEEAGVPEAVFKMAPIGLQ